MVLRVSHESGARATPRQRLEAALARFERGVNEESKRSSFPGDGSTCVCRSLGGENNSRHTPTSVASLTDARSSSCPRPRPISEAERVGQMAPRPRRRRAGAVPTPNAEPDDRITHGDVRTGIQGPVPLADRRPPASRETRPAWAMVGGGCHGGPGIPSSGYSAAYQVLDDLG